MTGLRRAGEWPGEVVFRRLVMRSHVRPWDDDADVAAIRVGFATDSFVEACVTATLEWVPTVRSPAVPVEEWPRWESRGFVPDLELMVMSCDLAHSPDVHGAASTHTGGLERLAEIDNSAFEKPWRVGRLGLRDALGATPRSEIFVTTDGEQLTGFAIVGADRYAIGYLQRVATHPNWQGRGVGSILIASAKAWALENACQRMVLNVRPDADGVIALYREHGFTTHSTILGVYRRDRPRNQAPVA